MANAKSSGSALARQVTRSARSGCAKSNEPSLRIPALATEATLKRFKLAQWFTWNVKDKEPSRTYVGLDVLDSDLWNLRGAESVSEFKGYMVAVEVADNPEPPQEGIVLVSRASGELTLLRCHSEGYRTMRGLPVTERVCYMGDVCYQGWTFR